MRDGEKAIERRPGKEEKGNKMEIKNEEEAGKKLKVMAKRR